MDKKRIAQAALGGLLAGFNAAGFVFEGFSASNQMLAGGVGLFCGLALMITPFLFKPRS